MKEEAVAKLTNGDMEALEKGVKNLVLNPRGFHEIVRGLLAPRPGGSVNGAQFLKLVNEIGVQCERVFDPEMDVFLAQAQCQVDRANRAYSWLQAHVPDDLDRLVAIARFFEEMKPFFGSGALASLLHDEISLERARLEQKRTRQSPA